jgi:hypothetical protein
MVFGTNFAIEHENPLSLRERARVRGSDKEHFYFFPSS